MYTIAERGKSGRIKCNTLVLHNTSPPDFFYRGTVRNISEIGLYFESNEDLSKVNMKSIKGSVYVEETP